MKPFILTIITSVQGTTSETRLSGIGRTVKGTIKQAVGYYSPDRLVTLLPIGLHIVQPSKFTDTEVLKELLIIILPLGLVAVDIEFTKPRELISISPHDVR